MNKFHPPSISSQFLICPVPFRVDSYFGCDFRCLYCFSRESVEFNRRNAEIQRFTHIEPNDPVKFKSWMLSAMKADFDPKRITQVAAQERIPLKIGTKADPFPLCESELKITYEMLNTLKDLDYPVQIQTKNPEGFLSYADEFKSANLTLSVTLITVDQAKSSAIELNSPSIQSRLDAMKRLADLGIPIFVKVQPVIPSLIENEGLDNLVKAIKDSGAWGFNIEHLKIKTALPEKEVKIYDAFIKRAQISNLQIVNGERVYPKRVIYENQKMARQIADRHGLSFFVADNTFFPFTNSCECCGTEKLRDYKLFAYDLRSLSYGNNKGSERFASCIINSDMTRNPNLRGQVCLKDYCKSRYPKPSLF